MIDAVEIAGDVLPRRWVRWAVLLLLAGMAVTGNYAPVVWFVGEEATKIQEDIVAPMLDQILRAAVPTMTPAATP